MAKRLPDQRQEAFAGIDNKNDPRDLAENYVQGLTNLDLDDSMHTSVRAGRTQIGTPNERYHSIFSDRDMSYGLICKYDSLQRLDVDNSGNRTLTVIRNDLTPNVDMDYLYLNGEVYYTNGFQSGIYYGTETTPTDNKPWGIPVPASQPALSPTVGGLNPGTYQVTCTYVGTDGREGGATLANTVTLASSGGIQLSNIPTSGDANIEYVRIYMTQPNGGKFYLAKQIADGTSSLAIQAFTHFTVPLLTQFMVPPPTGMRIAQCHGRIFVTKGKYIYFSEPLSYHLFREHNYFAFQSPVKDILAIPDGGLVVSADRLYFIPTNFKSGQEVSRKILANTRAIPRSGTLINGSDLGSFDGDDLVGIIATNQGICAISKNGSFRNLTDAHHAYNAGDRGATIVRDRNGYRQILSMVRDATAGGNKYVSPEAAPVQKQNGIT